MTTRRIVRHAAPAVIQALKQAAATHGRSIEAEHREILRAAHRRTIKEMLSGMPDVGTDEDFNARPPR